ncbi:MAG: aminotransferase class I/II-fold pyridoxal phosphate-dependent enzyme [Chloroflexota bacterium]
MQTPHVSEIIISLDEVYEHVIFDDYQHIPMATIPGMKDRTVTISSIGKTFSVTGWKTGWAIAAPELTQSLFRVHQFAIYSGVAPMQEAAAAALLTSQDYYDELAALYQGNRDYLIDVLADVGLKPITPGGTYYIMVEIGHLDFSDDVAFCHHLTQNVGVAAIPPSAFYSNPADGAKLARFAFCKTRETLEAAAERLAVLKQ